MYRRFRLPSKKLVEIRRVERGHNPECVVREVNDDNELSSHEYPLTLQFLRQRCEEVRNV